MTNDELMKNTECRMTPAELSFDHSSMVIRHSSFSR